MYGVLYAISPELFPAKDRGTGNGLTATATRVFGILVRHHPPMVFVAFHSRTTVLPGACDRSLCEFADRRAGLGIWCVDYGCRRTCAASAV